MLRGWAPALALAAYLPTLVMGCIQLHTYTKTGYPESLDRMYIKVWVNGQLVCDSFDDQGKGSSDNTKFSAQNGDGKGYGCAPGYSVVITQHGYDANFYYWGKCLKIPHTPTI